MTAAGRGARVWRGSRWLVAGAALALGAGCGDSPTGPLVPAFPTTAPHIAGRITQVTPTSDRSVSIRVETNPAEQSGSPKAIVRVDDFALVRTPGNADADYRALARGQWVRVWMDGAVIDTYPAQGIAKAVSVDSAAVVSAIGQPD